MLTSTNDVILNISNQGQGSTDLTDPSRTEMTKHSENPDKVNVRIMPAFRCGGMWPRSAQNWPRMENSTWPQQQVVTQIKV